MDETVVSLVYPPTTMFPAVSTSIAWKDVPPESPPKTRGKFVSKHVTHSDIRTFMRLLVLG